MAVKKKGLGAKGLGLNALINTEMEEIKASKKETKKTEEAVLELDLDLIEPNRKQPRKYFDENALDFNNNVEKSSSHISFSFPFIPSSSNFGSPSYTYSNNISGVNW